MNEALIVTLKNNGIAVMPTDTLYGIVGNAEDRQVVERVYAIKGRDEHKPFIILIPSIEVLASFGIIVDEYADRILNTVWPGAVTVILPVAGEEQSRLAYLHRGTNELAFRLPDKAALRALLQMTGPLIAPSANPQGAEPAHTIAEAQSHFGTTVDHYEDGGTLEGSPSTIIRLSDGEVIIVRQGATIVKLDK